MGADPTDIDIHSVRAPAYLWRPLVTYYSIWSVEYKESISIKMEIFIKLECFSTSEGREGSVLRPLYTIFVVKIPRLAISHCSAVLNLVTVNILYSHEYNVQLRVPWTATCSEPNLVLPYVQYENFCSFQTLVHAYL